jgi:formylglycine-generating enzyme required for sulfatase activity
MTPRAAAKTITKVASLEEPAEEASAAIGQRKKPEAGRYLLQVDRQTKGSYQTVEAAEQAGSSIKKAHPVVQVSIYDAVDCVNKIIEAA